MNLSLHATPTRRHLLAVLGCLLAAASLAHLPALGQTTGNRPIRMIVPFAAGSNTDAVARLIAPGLGERLGATIIIDNRAGANGVIGADAVAKAAPDGLTFLVGGASINVVNPALYKTLPYDPLRDLVPVARIGLAPLMLVVHPSLPFSNVAGLIDYAKKNPGKIAYGTPSSITMVTMETLKREAGIDMLSVPYKSSPQAITDLIANQIQIIASDFATAIQHVKAGKMRVIAVTMAKRSSLLPDVPTVDDVLKGFDITAWTAVFAPRGTAPETVARMATAIEAVLATRDVQDKLANIGFDIAPLGQEAFSRYVPAEIQNWSRLIRQAGIQPE